MKKKADRVAVTTARMPCMTLMPTDGCAHAMALRTVGSIHMSISSLSSVHAACTLTGGGMTPKRSACQSSNAGFEMLLTSVVIALISTSSGESAESLSWSPSSVSERMSREKSRLKRLPRHRCRA
eukprot:3187221-Pleurochrysis_carterae.AAC.1